MQFNLDYFYGNEASEFRFYRVPKALLGGELSLEAATLYSLMLDRVGLSVKTAGWTAWAGCSSILSRRTCRSSSAVGTTGPPPSCGNWSALA